mmetsp:Transcript_8004/g.11646  ORF Transcript_8004/g.11646 Transcript_8004/m.11646 type:complete len:358 (+) Transcript_8004:34-1107(+)
MRQKRVLFALVLFALFYVLPQMRMLASWLQNNAYGTFDTTLTILRNATTNKDVDALSILRNATTTKNKDADASLLCVANPYIESLNASLSDIAFQAKEWLSHMDTHLMKASQPEMLHHTHARFFPFQVMSACEQACVGGGCGADTSKIVCGMEQLHFLNDKECVVYSIGGNNEWQFELDVLGGTSCQVYTFDCTGSKSRFQKPQDDRLSFHHICLGAASQPAPGFADNCTQGICGPIMTLQEIQKMLGHNQIDLFKMDIEGYEWPIFESWPELSDNETDSIGFVLPMQILVEIHYQTGDFPDLFRPGQTHWRQDFKLPEELVRLQAHLLRMGYAVVAHDDNRACPHCTELTLMRFKC